MDEVVMTNAQVSDALNRYLSQASAMLSMIYRGGIENFDECSSEVRGNYLWACADVVGKAHALVKQINS